jgi:hypothetical protein
MTSAWVYHVFFLYSVFHLQNDVDISALIHRKKWIKEGLKSTQRLLYEHKTSAQWESFFRQKFIEITLSRAAGFVGEGVVMVYI